MSLEICEEVIKTMKEDSAIQAYTGYTVNDPRIYSWNPMFNIIFATERPVAIFHRYSQAPDPNPERSSFPTQKGNIYFYFQVKSPDKTLAMRCAERIKNLFRNQPLNSDNYKIGIIRSNGNNDGTTEGTPTRPIYVRNINLLLKEIFKKHEFQIP